MKIKKIVTLFSIGLFIVSLPQDCFCTSSNCVNSFMALISGWMGVIGGDIAGIAWFANIFLLLSWIFTLNNVRYAIWTSLLSTLFCLTFLLGKKVIINEAGQSGAITAYKAGFVLWVISSIVMSFGNMILIAIKPIPGNK